MAKRVYKYPLTIVEGEQVVSMPLLAKIVHVGIKDGETNTIYLWAEINDQQRPTTRTFQVHPTGQYIDDQTDYVGTVIKGQLVWHVYEVR